METKFSHLPGALQEKKKIALGQTQSLHVNLVVDFLFAQEAKVDMNVEFLGPATKKFLVGRCRWLMGPIWNEKSRNSILRKVRKHLQYVQSTAVRRSQRKKKEKRVMDL